MNHAVIKYPNEYTISVQRDLGDETGPLLEGEELMTTEALHEWLESEPQVTKRNAIIAAAEAKRAAAEAELKAKQDAQIALLAPTFGEELARKIVLSNV